MKALFANPANKAFSIGIVRFSACRGVEPETAAEDGEFCVALRCALLDGKTAHCYAGVGVVAGSDPAAELDETEIKLGAIIPALSA